MDDLGALPACARRRRWLRGPAVNRLGAGIVPADGALGPGPGLAWIADGPLRLLQVNNDSAASGPAPRVLGRGSFSLPGADFHRAPVLVAREGRPLSLPQERPEDQSAADGAGAGVGADFPVWTLPGYTVGHAAAGTDRVRLANVIVAGPPRGFIYPVTSLDPARRIRLDPPAGQDGECQAGNVAGVR